MWIDVISLTALLAVLSPAETPLHWEAEALADRVSIAGGGDLLRVPTPDPERLPFSGGQVLTFAPVGKGAALELRLPVPEKGIYKLRVRGVVGPSCGVYRLRVGDRVCAEWNFHATATRHSDRHPQTKGGLRSKRMALKAGDNLLRFEFVGAPGRMGDLVLDTLELLPEVRKPPKHTYDPYDKELPANERLGPELVVNGGFEAFRPDDAFRKQHQRVQGWKFNSAVPTEHPPILRDPAQAHGGRHALRLAPDPLEDNAIVYQSVATHSGKTYRVSLWARGEGTLMVVFYQRPPAKTEDTQRGLNTFKAGEDWQLYSFLFSPSRSAKATQAAIALYALRDSRIVFDDVSVREVLAR